MNRTLSLSLAVAAAALVGNAFADDITVDPTPFVSSRTRAEVLQELKEYRASGVNPWADDYNPVASLKSERTREEVRGEYLAERDKVAAFGGEDSGSMYMARAQKKDNGIQMAGDPVEIR